jgi:hypothetical protein
MLRPRLCKSRNTVLSSAHQHSNDSNNSTTRVHSTTTLFIICKIMFHIWRVIITNISTKTLINVPLSTIFQIYCGGLSYSWRKPNYPKKKTGSVASHWQTASIMLFLVHLAISRIRTHNVSSDMHWLYIYL